MKPEKAKIHDDPTNQFVCSANVIGIINSTWVIAGLGFADLKCAKYDCIDLDSGSVRI